MSRFCFCNCPAGFSAPPERHAPDCPGRSGAGKAPTPVPAVIAAPLEADEFSGNNAQLIKAIETLLDMDAKGVLVPHGIGGAARQLLNAAASRLPPFPNRLCHIDYTAHPYRCGCLSGDDEAQRRFNEHQRDTKLAADEGEIERLRGELGQVKGEYDRAVNRVSAARDEIESLRAQLALPAEIGRLINSQDNRHTDQPLFAVLEKRAMVTLDTHDHDRIEWYDSDNGTTADERTAQRLDAIHFAGREVKRWERYAVKDIDVFVTACFTEQGCIDFLARDGHNHTKPFIYAFGSYRNAEYQSLRNWLKALPATIQKPEGHKCPNCDTGTLKENNYAWHCDSCDFIAPEQDGELDE